jgi:hypothetical protein
LSLDETESVRRTTDSADRHRRTLRPTGQRRKNGTLSLKAIAAFAGAEEFDFANEYTEIETGRGADALAPAAAERLH